MDLVTYTFTTMVIAAAPGPVMATIALRSLTGATRGALAFSGGVILCEVLLLAAAMAGAIALLDTAPGVLAAAGWIGIGYLLWVAIDLWRNPPDLRSVSGGRGVADLSAGFAIAAANPYNATFYLTVLPALGWRIEAMPGLVVLATLMPSFLVYGGTIALTRIADLRLGTADRPLFRRALAMALGAAAVWIAVG